MNYISKLIFSIILLIWIQELSAQTLINLSVNADSVISVIPPIWRDHYEAHLLAGYGQNPMLYGPHKRYIDDPSFYPEMQKLQARYIRISLGRMDNPPDTNYFSADINTLKNLPYEFYRGANDLNAANDLTNYHFQYIDSLIELVQSIGAKPFITLDYMPFTLSSDTLPDYNALLPILYYLGYNNSIRNGPPIDNQVYGRVIYHLIKHCYIKYQVEYFEHWNEPDQQWLNPLFAHFYWTGDEYELYDAYKAISDEIIADTSLSNHIKLGGCSFALYSLLQQVPIHFLQMIKANKDKFDFLSFHPYSDIQWRGGYDSSKVSMVTQWRDSLCPDATLIIGEWGRIDPNTSVWGDLDYGLDKLCHQIDMLNRNISMAHDVCMFDANVSTSNYDDLGMYRVEPVIAKPSAYVAYNMNEMNDAANRLALDINPGMYALAVRNDAKDKIIIAFPAPKPGDGNNIVQLSITNIPWESNYFIHRYELTEASYSQGIVFNPVKSGNTFGEIYRDTLPYQAIDSSGRLIIWELIPDSSMINISYAKQNKIFQVFPNPATSMVHFNQPANIQLFNFNGKLILERQQTTALNFENLVPGIYLLIFMDKKGLIIQQERIVIQ